MKLDYIQQAYNGLYDSWRYIIGTAIIFIAWQFIGAIPLGIFLVAEVFNGGTAPTSISGMVELLGSNLFLFLMLISFAVGLVGVILSAKLLHKQSFRSLTTARKKIDWSRFWFIFILWGVISSGLVFLDYYLSPESYVFSFDAKAFIILAIIGITLLPLQTSFEEYFFRGYLMQGIGIVCKNRWAPLIITSVGFGMLHIFNPEVDTLGPVIMIFYIGTGLILGIMTLMDEGLELALGFHAANNLFTALLVTADWTALQTDSILTDVSDPTEVSFLEIALPVLIIYPLILFVLSKKYGWNNWKEKLFGKVSKPPKEDYKVLE